MTSSKIEFDREVKPASLGKSATVSMRAGRFDDVASVLCRLVSTEFGRPYGPPHPRRIVILWNEIAEVVAAGDRALLSFYLKEAEHRLAPHVFVVREISEGGADLGAARSALRSLLDLEPRDLEARQCLVDVLIRSDLVEEAEREIDTHLAGSSSGEVVEALRGRAAMRKQDWDAAHSAWIRYLGQRSDDASAVSTLYRVNLVRQLKQAVEANDGTRPFPIDPGYRNEPETRDLLLRFEGIGADCDFGSVQRLYGAEPLGLLRWAGTDISSLMAALAARFEGMGDPLTTRLVVGPDGHILLRDVRWGFPMHTFLFEREVSLAALHPKMCRRMAFLRDKFLEDLSSGKKTFVFKSDLADQDDLLDLHDALLAFGPARLLNVRTPSAADKLSADEPGGVRQVRPGLFIGGLSGNDPGKVLFDEWVTICRCVERLIEADA